MFIWLTTGWSSLWIPYLIAHPILMWPIVPNNPKSKTVRDNQLISLQCGKPVLSRTCPQGGNLWKIWLKSEDIWRQNPIFLGSFQFSFPFLSWGFPYCMKLAHPGKVFYLSREAIDLNAILSKGHLDSNFLTCNCLNIWSAPSQVDIQHYQLEGDAIPTFIPQKRRKHHRLFK